MKGLLFYGIGLWIYVHGKNFYYFEKEDEARFFKNWVESREEKT